MERGKPARSKATLSIPRHPFPSPNGPEKYMYFPCYPSPTLPTPLSPPPPLVSFTPAARFLTRQRVSVAASAKKFLSSHSQALRHIAKGGRGPHSHARLLASPAGPHLAQTCMACSVQQATTTACERVVRRTATRLGLWSCLPSWPFFPFPPKPCVFVRALRVCV